MRDDEFAGEELDRAASGEQHSDSEMDQRTADHNIVPPLRASFPTGFVVECHVVQSPVRAGARTPLERRYTSKTLTWASIIVVVGTILPWRPVAGKDLLPRNIRVLSYNVHGAAWLPSVVGYAPAVVGMAKAPHQPLQPDARMARIAGKLPNHDLILLQEDFQYASRLERHLARVIGRQPSPLRGNGPVFRWGYIPAFPFWGACMLTLLCGVPPMTGAGLTMYALDRELAIEPLQSAPYRDCAGYLLGGNDCLAAKGFLGISVRLSDRHVIHVYTTHLDASPGKRNAAVRDTQLAELAQAIEGQSSGEAVIVTGDFNIHREKSDELPHPIQRFASQLQLTDSGAAGEPSAKWPENLDYILYRCGGGLSLTVEDKGEALDFWTRGRPLSDHPAVFALFEVAEGVCP